MTVTIRKYNPGFLSDEELVGSFCVRLDLFESMVECLRECTGNANTHQIVIGPRGSGKTSLLLRVAAEIRRNESLSSRFFPVVFAEESYEVSSAGEFWLECLSRLADQASVKPNEPDLKRSYEELRRVPDDQMLGDRCLGLIQDFADREGKRLVLIVENLNMMFADFVDKDTGWRLRQPLQTERRIILLASATTRFDEIDSPDCAFYDLFRELTLRPLEPDECEVLWKTISDRDCQPETIRALRILTGGSPRLLTIVARFGANLSFRDLMIDLLDLVDDHTEYFKSHLDSLPAQERRVYLTLVDLWKPATAREIAERARSDTSKCSAQLARLADRGVVEVIGGSTRRKQYYITERLYNIYYLMRRSRGSAPLVEALIQFMEAYYSPSELKDFVIRTVQDAMGLDNDANGMHQIALGRLLKSPFLSEYRQELSTLVMSNPAFARNDMNVVKELVNKAAAIAGKGQESDEIALWDEVIQRLESSSAEEDLEIFAAALVFKGIALEKLNRMDEAIKVWDDIVRCNEMSEVPNFTDTAVVLAIAMKAVGLHERGQLEEALVVSDEFARRFESSASLKIRDAVAFILVNKGEILVELNQTEEALSVWKDVVRRFASSDTKFAQISVAMSLLYRGRLLVDLNLPKESLEVIDEVIRRFESIETELPVQAVLFEALLHKGRALTQLNRLPEAIAAYDEILNCNNVDATLESETTVAMALLAKGEGLVKLSRMEAALTVWDDVERRFGMSDNPNLCEAVKMAQLGIAGLHFEMGQGDASVAAASRLFETKISVPPWIGCQGRFARARAFLLKGDKASSMRDIETALSILPDLEFLPKMVIYIMCDLAVELGSAQLRELILASPASNLLLPLTTALERDLGLETRVAKEVEEVVKDIQRDLDKRRKEMCSRGD